MSLQNRSLMVVAMALSMATTGCGALGIGEETDKALQAWAERTGETDPCRIDAMQHCIAASATAAMLGPDLALLLGGLLEIQQGDGDPMDLHNNEAGASCALPISGEGDGAVACCETLLNAVPSQLRTDGRCR